MRQQKRKCREPAAGNLIKGLWRDEIVADVLELWIGISRLMAHMSGSPQFEITAAKPLPDKKTTAARRRKAA